MSTIHANYLLSNIAKISQDLGFLESYESLIDDLGGIILDCGEDIRFCPDFSKAKISENIKDEDGYYWLTCEFPVTLLKITYAEVAEKTKDEGFLAVSWEIDQNESPENSFKADPSHFEFS